MPCLFCITCSLLSNISLVLLGWIYKLYMGLLAVFCTNSINIHAGINGLEVGQTVVIACAVRQKNCLHYSNLSAHIESNIFLLQILIHNIMQIGAATDMEHKQAHVFSIYLVQPLLATSLALLSFNWYWCLYSLNIELNVFRC